MSGDPYEALGIPREASETNVKKAYRNLARQHHPDKGGNPEQFKKVQEAYEILSNPEKRRNFDQFGNPDGPLGPQHQGGPGGFPADIFAQMFGGGGPRGPVKRANFDHELKVSLEESYRGTVRNMRVTLDKVCFSCQTKCSHCHGRGSIPHQMGPIVMNHPCGACQGRGGVSRGCGACEGRGRKKEVLNLELKIQAGIEDGNVLVGYGLGEQPQKEGEDPGDILFHIRVEQHPDLMRQGPDLIWQTRISFEDSVNGKTLKVPHFDGPITVDTSDWGVLDPREDYIIPNKGFVNGGRLRVQFNIVYPDRATRFTLSKVPESGQ